MLLNVVNSWEQCTIFGHRAFELLAPSCISVEIYGGSHRPQIGPTDRYKVFKTVQRLLQVLRLLQRLPNFENSLGQRTILGDRVFEHLAQSRMRVEACRDPTGLQMLPNSVLSV